MLYYRLTEVCYKLWETLKFYARFPTAAAAKKSIMQEEALFRNEDKRN